jgi:hypothetical protein
MPRGPRNLRVTFGAKTLVSIKGGLASWHHGSGTDRKDPGLES